MLRVLTLGCISILLAGCEFRGADFSSPRGCLDASSSELSQAKTELASELAAGQSFPFEFELTDVYGEPIRKEDFQGQVLIVDIWGTWCPPCRRELPHFIALHERYGAEGLAIVGLNSERGTPDAQAQTVRTFKQQFGIPYRCAILSDKVMNQITPFEGFPTTLFFDRTGKLRLKIVGYHDMAVLQGAVEILLAEK